MDYTKNNNSKTIRNLVKNSLKANRRRNIATIITIAFSVCVVLSLALTFLAVNQANYNSVKDTYQAIVRNADNKEITELIGDSRIEKAGVTYLMDFIKMQNGNIYLFYSNDEMINSLPNLQGTAPIDENEIVVSKAYLDMIEHDADINDIIQLNIGKETDGVFKITGIIDDTELQRNTFTMFFSKSYLEQFYDGKSIDYNVYLWLENVHSYSAGEAQEIITQVCADSDINAERLSFNSPYFQYVGWSINTTTLLPVILIGTFLLFAAAVVIYTIFYISVGGKIREYGQLRTIGATQKQIKRIVVYEGMILAIFGGVAGILPGWAIGYALQPRGWNITNTLLATLVVVFLTIFIVWISVLVPAKMAGSISSIEAGRYMSYMPRKQTVNVKTGYKKSTPLRIAFLNITRNFKKTALTMLSLGLCGTLFICVASLQKNITAENIVRSVAFQYGDYKLVVIGSEQNDYSEVQQLNNPLTEKLRNEILALDGVESIREWRAINGKISIESANIINSSINIFGYAPQDEIKLTSALIDGTADYNELSQNNGIIINSPDTIKEIYGWEPQLGDIIELITIAENGEYVESTLVVMGFTEKNDGFTEFLRMTDTSLQQITGTACVDSWEIITSDSVDDTIEPLLINLLQGNINIQLRTYSDALEEQQAAFDTSWGLFYLLALLLGVFGIINLINTHTTNMLSRKQEIGIFKAVGMTSKQLRLSLILEGLINTLTATLITIVVGIPMGYIAYTLADSSQVAMYRLPWQAALIYFIVLLVVQLFLIGYDVRVIAKTSVIERVRNVA